MFLFALVLGLLFLPQADTLKCKCESSTYGICPEETINCFSQEDRCVAATEVKVVGGVVVSEFKFKHCIMSELCTDYSVNYGDYRIAQKTSCCSGDLCNAQINYTRPDYKSTPNGRKCFTCDGKNCMKTLHCVGDENYCFKITENTQGVNLKRKGCASEFLCSNKRDPWMNQVIEPKITCCQGNYCNSASSASPILLLLLVPLLFSGLFS